MIERLNINNFGINTITFPDTGRAELLWQQFTKEQQRQMAKVYQQAFGGEPWYEKYTCNVCRIFTAEFGECPNCGRQLEEAYPTEWLITEYFPKMLSDYVPGVLLVVQNQRDEIVGFSNGGFNSIGLLVANKYPQNPEQILASMTKQFGLSAEDRVFYDNETCLLPQNQRSGLGKQLSQKRLQAALDLRAKLICGRTINLPWLELKKQQLTNKGFLFESDVLKGDTYQVDNVSRRFYLATKS